MHIKALSKAFTFFDMRNVFQIVLEVTVDQIQAKLQTVFSCQQTLDNATTTLLANATNPILQDSKVAAATAERVVSTELDAIGIEATDILMSFKTIDSATIR